MISSAAIEELKVRNPCDAVAAQWVKLRAHGARMRGPCPLHSPDPNARDSTAFECWPEGWVCATCQDGGDVIKLTALRHGLDPQRDFIAAVELLGGVNELSAERAAELERERVMRADKRAREANIYRERERRSAFSIWHAGVAWPGTPVETYLRECRGIAALPERLQLRFAPVVAFFHGEETNEIGRKQPRVIHRGPAMLAAFVDPAGFFRAVHITWLDLDRPKGKPLIIDPDTGAPIAKTKKMRGSTDGNAIRLVGPTRGVPPSPVDDPSVLYVGEGIEKVLAVWYALHRAGRVLDRAAFWSAGSLGNLVGKAASSVPHPTLKDAANRRRRVPGPDPDLADAGLRVPAGVKTLVLLGDGTGDRFTAQCALARATARYSRDGRRTLVAWSPDGVDFDDLLRAAA